MNNSNKILGFTALDKENIESERFRELRRFLHNRLIDGMEEQNIHLLKDTSQVERRLERLIEEIRPRLNPVVCGGCKLSRK